MNLLQKVEANDPLKFHFLFNEDGEQVTEFNKHGTVHRFPFQKLKLLEKIVNKIHPFIWRIAKQIYCLWLFKIIKPDLIYINSVTKNVFNSYASSSSIPFIVHLHETDFLVTFTNSEKWLNTIINRSKILLACSAATSDFYHFALGAPKSKIYTIHSPSNLERLMKLDNNSESFQYDKIAKPTIVIGIVASFSFLKGPDIMIQTANILNQSYKNLIFLWIGVNKNISVHTSLYFQAVQKLLDEFQTKNFHFLPATNNLKSFYEKIDILVIPSRTESLGLSIQEAMLFEKPVVAMDVGGVREVVDEQTGYLVKDRTPEGLAEGIIHFLESEKLRKETGKRGRERVLKNFEAEVQVKKWLQILHELTD